MNYQIMKSIDVDQFKVRQSEPEANLGISQLAKNKKYFLKFCYMENAAYTLCFLKFLYKNQTFYVSTSHSNLAP